MAQQGKTQLLILIIAPSDQAAEGDRLFGTHMDWMRNTHHRDGEKALLTYNVSKAAELSNPMDPDSAPTGNTIFILAEVYESPAGVADHFAQAESSWPDFPAFMDWIGKCNTTMIPAAEIGNSLW